MHTHCYIIAQPSAMDWAGLPMYVHAGVSTPGGMVARRRVLSSSVHSPPLFHPPPSPLSGSDGKAGYMQQDLVPSPSHPSFYLGAMEKSKWEGLVPINTC